jgi:hypothetical protein
MVEFGRDVIARGSGEIGMHLHAWDTPPLYDLTGDDHHHQPYLVEYPPEVIEQKVATMTGLLEDTFGVKMRSHRAGRWGFDERYARLLLEHSYMVDCSVTPHVSWRGTMGDPKGNGGSDYSGFPETAYFIDPGNIGRTGDSALLEVPFTVMKAKPDLPGPVRSALGKVPFVRRVVSHYLPAVSWLRPNRRNRRALLTIVDRAAREDRDYLEFMLHSSEFMPGGSPTFSTQDDIERLFDDIDAVFSAAVTAGYQGRTLTEYALSKERPH